MEITIDKRALVRWGMALLILTVIASAIWVFWPQIQQIIAGESAPAATLALAEEPAGLAAAEGVRVFYTLDSQNLPVDQWLANICAVSSEFGCFWAQQFGIPSVTALYASMPLGWTSSATAEPVMIMETLDDGIQVWRVHLAVAPDWMPAQDVYAEVEQEGGEWKFSRILFSQEAVPYEATPNP